MAPIKLSNLQVYRIVHYSNLEYILKNGLYVWQHANSDSNYVNIGSSEIINFRKDFPVKISGYGNIGDYIPFYWGRQSVMLYNILTGKNGIARHPPADIVYLCCNFEGLIKTCSKFFFTDGQANKKLTNHFNRIEDLDKIHWDIINGSDFKKSEDDPDKIRKYQAECLIHQYVPTACIGKIVVYNKSRAESVKQILKNLELNTDISIATKNYYFHF